ncbi:FAD-dependent oxidoreductase [Candidatus Bathyarchaeota archaeon]|nr:FAD-dependent oxidoreductase [Candidatus Bathyarchaeota archaeon]
MSEDIYDIIIIGGGPAGLTAAIYTARHNNKTLVLEGNKLGGKTLQAHWVENYPGFPDGISGPDLMALMERQAANFGAEFSTETVVGIADFGETKMLTTRKGVRQAKAVIIATGMGRKSLSVKGENEFKGRGVSYCGVCDGPFFRDKTVAIIGGGHEAVHDIEILMESATKVYAIPGKKGFSEEYSEIEHLKKEPKVEFIYDADINEIGGTDFVEYIKLDNGDEIKLDGVFIILEHVSASTILGDAGVDTDEGGCIMVDRNQMTNMDGIFAAGDCCCMGMQIVTATGMGAQAALTAMKYVKRMVKK